MDELHFSPAQLANRTEASQASVNSAVELRPQPGIALPASGSDWAASAIPGQAGPLDAGAGRPATGKTGTHP
ncbi:MULTISPECIES: hypothetical protein [Pseudomonas]|uniref:hypothetical protein n=1 Tax=Pseudomonas TaxID=286 RepID=UPI000CD1A428|nr:MULTISPECIES: hypothetical protein [unclassified Pseudomonas]POA53941.1 hypothetical protein C1889_17225 [Pseudomonas sp. FW507-12TSA]